MIILLFSSKYSPIFNGSDLEQVVKRYWKRLKIIENCKEIESEKDCQELEESENLRKRNQKTVKYRGIQWPKKSRRKKKIL